MREADVLQAPTRFVAAPGRNVPLANSWFQSQDMILDSCGSKTMFVMTAANTRPWSERQRGVSVPFLNAMKVAPASGERARTIVFDVELEVSLDAAGREYGDHRE